MNTSRSALVRHLVWVFIGTVCLCTLIVLVVMNTMPDRGKALWNHVRAALEDRDNWTHAELIDHLEKQGLKFHYRAGKSSFIPVMYFWTNLDNGLTAVVADLGGQTEDSIGMESLWVGVVRVEKWDHSPRDEAATHGERAFAYHNFLFRGDPEFIAEIRKVLRR